MRDGPDLQRIPRDGRSTLAAAMSYPFLSAEWIAAAKAIRDEYADRVKPPDGIAVRANLVITAGPDGHDIEAHLDAGGEGTHVELGHLNGPDVTITTDYGTAKSIFADQDAQAAMAAFMGGRIRVEGDTAKLMVMMAQAQQTQLDPVALEIAAKVRSITS
jgi:hypothetical protein